MISIKELVNCVIYASYETEVRHVNVLARYLINK